MSSINFALGLLLAVFLSVPASARTLTDSARSKISNFAFGKVKGDADYSFDYILGKLNLGKRCIENFSNYEQKLKAVRLQLDNQLAPLVRKFYANTHSPAELANLRRELAAYNVLVSAIENDDKRRPVVFRIDAECTVPTEAHRKNAKALHWDPLLRALRKIVAIVDLDLGEIDKDAQHVAPAETENEKPGDSVPAL